jgi:hypothetical protein
MNFKFYFNIHVNYIFYYGINLLLVVRSVTFTFSSFECMNILHFAPVISKLEYDSADWNSFTSLYANKLEASRRTSQPFVWIVPIPKCVTVSILCACVLEQSRVTSVYSSFFEVCRCYNSLRLVCWSGPCALYKKPSVLNVCSLQPPAHAGSSLADLYTLKMEAIHFSETSVYTISIRRHIPEDGILYNQSFVNFRCSPWCKG